MKNPDCFSKILYVVAWAGCKIPLSGRSFDNADEAIEMFKVWLDAPSIRVEVMEASFKFYTGLDKEKFEKNEHEKRRESKRRGVEAG